MSTTPHIRAPAVAGRFYPLDAERLHRDVQTWLEGRELPNAGRVRAWIAPHAGFLFSGPTAARAYATAGSDTGRVWLLGPSHFTALSGTSASTAAAFATPLGQVACDTDMIAQWQRRGWARINDHAHAPEHSLETHLPFMQVLGWNCPIVPLLTRDGDDADLAEHLDSSLAPGDRVAVSSDLSHFLRDEQARNADARTALAIESGDLEAIGPRQACGWVAVRALMRLARARGCEVERLHLCNSSDTAGDKERVVGYGAWRFLEKDSAA